MAPDYYGIEMVISGGQTGADQGGLMAAWDHDILTGGKVPSEFRTCIGPNPLLEILGLTCTKENDYRARTLENVENSDGTIICGYDLRSPGSAMTREACIRLNKPVYSIEFPVIRSDVKLIASIEGAVDFIAKHRIRVLNVAGNRDTSDNQPNYRATREVLYQIFDLIKTRFPMGK